MFDLTSDPAKRATRGASLGASLGSSAAAIAAHLAGLTVLIAIPVSRAVIAKPEPVSIQAFVVPADRLPPVSAPRPPAAAPPRNSQPAHQIEPPAAPIDAPVEIKPEPASPSLLESPEGEGGVEGGVAGGIAGGVVGGSAGAVADMARTAVPVRAPTRPAVPLRVSGAIKPPDLLHRVDPTYSAIAAASHLSGVVILEAVVDEEGAIQSVKTVRSSNPLLDRAAIDALKQWKYAPLVLAGEPTPFIVTATFRFRFPAVL